MKNTFFFRLEEPYLWFFFWGGINFPAFLIFFFQLQTGWVGFFDPTYFSGLLLFDSMG